jgi:hypothetical protein
MCSIIEQHKDDGGNREKKTNADSKKKKFGRVLTDQSSRQFIHTSFCLSR